MTHVFRIASNCKATPVNDFTVLQLSVQLEHTRSITSKENVTMSVQKVAANATTTLTLLRITATFVRKATPLTMASALKWMLNALTVKSSLTTSAMIAPMGVLLAP